MPAFSIAPATNDDDDALWRLLEPTLRAGETYPLPCDMTRGDALDLWRGDGMTVFLAKDGDEPLGTYYLRANQRGGGGHVANCGYVTAEAARGRGVATALCEHSMAQARERGFDAMQFNFVVATNRGAIRLWQRHGFVVVGRLPRAFEHPREGKVDALVMHRPL